MIPVSIVQAMACAMNWMVHVIATTIIMVSHVKRQNVRTTVRDRWDGDVAMTIGECGLFYYFFFFEISILN